MNKDNEQLVRALIGLAATIVNAMDADPEFFPCNRPAGVVMDNVAAVAEELPAEEVQQRTAQVLALMEHVGDHHGATVAGAYAGELTEFKLQLVDALSELSAVTLPALERGVNDCLVSGFFYRGLAACATDDTAVKERIAQLPEIALAAREL